MVTSSYADRAFLAIVKNRDVRRIVRTMARLGFGGNQTHCPNSSPSRLETIQRNHSAYQEGDFAADNAFQSRHIHRGLRQSSLCRPYLDGGLNGSTRPVQNLPLPNRSHRTLLESTKRNLEPSPLSSTSTSGPRATVVPRTHLLHSLQIAPSSKWCHTRRGVLGQPPAHLLAVAPERSARGWAI